MSSPTSPKCGDVEARGRHAYPADAPDSFDLTLPLPPSAGRRNKSAASAKRKKASSQLRAALPVLPVLPPRQLCYSSPRLLSGGTCSSGDAGCGDCKGPLQSAWTGPGRAAELDTTRSCVADSCITTSSRRTLISTAATTAPSETGALMVAASTATHTPSHPPTTEGQEPQDAQMHSTASDCTPAASVADAPGRKRVGTHLRPELSDCPGASDPSCPRSPAGSTPSSVSDATVPRANSWPGGRAAALPTLPKTPGASYEAADEIFDVGQLCRRLSHCHSGEVIALSNRTLQPPTDSWPVVLHDHGPILPTCDPPAAAAAAGRCEEAGFVLRPAEGIVTCMYGVHATVRDAILTTGERTCVLLDATCGNVVFEDVCFQGGAIICRGHGCRVTLTRVDLQTCTIVALDGADVTLHDTSATASAATVFNVFASGPGTTVRADQVTLTDGLVGVSVQGGAHFTGSLVTVTGTYVAGLHACGAGSYLHVKRGHIYDPATPENGEASTDGVVVADSAVCLLEDTAVAHIEIGIAIRSRGRGILKNCRMHGSVGSSVVVTDGGVEMFDCAMEFSGGCGMLLQQGSEAEAHGCTFAQSTLNAVYVQQGSDAILRWCTLEFSAVWSGLEVEGQGSSVECHSCLLLRNKHCGVFVHSGAEADLSACESEGNGMSGYRVHGSGTRLRLDGCCAKDVIAYQTHHNGHMLCASCSPGGDIMAEALVCSRESTGSEEVASRGGGERAASAVVGTGKRQKRSFFKALVRAIDRKLAHM
eukprot:jgi/Ulvmu1/6886/UM031_0092.1